MNIKFRYSFLILLVIFSCTDKDQNANEIAIKRNTEIVSFSSFFDKIQEITLNQGGFPENVVPPRSVYILHITKDKSLIVPDLYEKTILVFNSNGKFIKNFGREGRGPNEFEIIKSSFFGNDDKLWIYDLSLKRISVYQSPSFDLISTKSFEHLISDFIITDKEEIIAYTPLNNENFLVNKYSIKGDLLEQALKVEDEALRIFLGRFQDGGISEGFRMDDFIVVYPGINEVKNYSVDFRLLKLFKFENSSSDSFEIKVPEFPSKLDPYGYNRSHDKWWQSFNHIHKIFKLEDDKILIQYYKQGAGKNFQYFASIFDIDGENIGFGIEIPDDGQIVAIKDGIVYISKPERITKNGAIEPTKIITYKLK